MYCDDTPFHFISLLHEFKTVLPSLLFFRYLFGTCLNKAHVWAAVFVICAHVQDLGLANFNASEDV